MTEDQVNDLSGLALEYAFAKACGFSMVGTTELFALSGLTGELLIFEGEEQSVTYASFRTNYAGIVLVQGQQRHAQLSTRGVSAVCKIGDVEATGVDYQHAMMRAIILADAKQEQP